jgi:hypothetical protein
MAFYSNKKFLSVGHNDVDIEHLYLTCFIIVCVCALIYIYTYIYDLLFIIYHVLIIFMYFVTSSS